MSRTNGASGTSGPRRASGGASGGTGGAADGPGTRAAAYMDLDKTILATSATFAMGTPMRRSGLISATALARSILRQLPYMLSGADEEQLRRLMEELARLSRGLEPVRIRQVVDAALATVIEPAVYTEALDLIEAHHRAGHDVVVVSASVEELVTPIAALIGADRALATRMEVDAQGRFTGRISHCLMHEAKALAMADDARVHGIDLASSWAYSDSVSDLPMLRAVGHPVAVNPDRELRRRALEEGWPVRDLTRPVRVPTASGTRLAALARPSGLRAELAVGAALVLAAGALAAWATWTTGRGPGRGPGSRPL